MDDNPSSPVKMSMNCLRLIPALAGLFRFEKGLWHPVFVHPSPAAGFFRQRPEYAAMKQGDIRDFGGGRMKLKTADETACIMLDALLQDLNIQSGEKIMLVLDGMGATTLMELFIVYRRCASYLREQNITINRRGNLPLK